MRISALETVRLDEFSNVLWARLHTDVGLGETFFGARAVEAYLHESAAMTVLGRDPLAIERIGRDLTPYIGFAGTGAETRGRSAVDIALWDLFGAFVLHRLVPGAGDGDSGHRRWLDPASPGTWARHRAPSRSRTAQGCARHGESWTVRSGDTAKPSDREVPWCGVFVQTISIGTVLRSLSARPVLAMISSASAPWMSARARCSGFPPASTPFSRRLDSSRASRSPLV